MLYLFPARRTSYLSRRNSSFDTHTGRRNAKRTLENIAGGDVELSSEEFSEINRVISSHEIKGGRYFDAVPDEKLGLWG
jgi:hypothetical protein